MQTIQSGAASDHPLTPWQAGAGVARSAGGDASGRVPPTRLTRPYVSLFWRLFLPNAAVVVGSGIVRWIQPAHGHVIALAVTVVVMLALNLLLMRWAFAPLAKLNASMRSIKPPAAGTRIDISGPESEVTLLAHSFNDMLDRLETERRDSARRALHAQEEERRRIASELHDGLGQDLTALMLELRAITADSSDRIRPRLRATEERALQIVEDVRRLARQLRPEALDELGLIPALAALCKRISGPTGLHARLEPTHVLSGLTADQELTVYRVVQESLTNVVRHSQAREAIVRLRDDGRTVTLTIEDDGHGLSRSPQLGGGINGMRERAMLNAGHLVVEPSERGGVRVLLRVERRHDP